LFSELWNYAGRRQPRSGQDSSSVSPSVLPSVRLPRLFPQPPRLGCIGALATGSLASSPLLPSREIAQGSSLKRALV
jgi:hypothetical protein